ncbi:MAG: pimeloyl-ACP methyl ester esterase BioH [Buchnera aphidicola (Schlechtendalia chinensis)]
MKNFYWNTIGTGKINLVLIHGFGFNSKIWNALLPALSVNFTIHPIDLPGFGENNTLKFMNLKKTAKLLEKNIPNNSILLGWSIGGLIVSKISLLYPKKIKGLISVSSSPCFLMHQNWPGIRAHTLSKLYYELTTNYEETIQNFIDMQPIIYQNYNEEIFNLKKDILSYPKPNTSTLKKGLKILQFSDLRNEIVKLKIPFLRIYGKLDTFVPKEIVKILDIKWPHTKSIIMEKCAHAPFISKKYKFSKIILEFSKSLNC